MVLFIAVGDVLERRTMGVNGGDIDWEFAGIRKGGDDGRCWFNILLF